MKYWEKWKSYLPLAGVLAVAVCMVISLSGYEPPVFAAADEADTDTEQTGEQTEEEPVQGSFDLEDGVYEGTGTGFAGSIKVAVTIKDHTITAIEILSKSDDAAFFNRAKAMIDRIMEKQSLDVDTVSGATYSSRGILRAVKNALTGEKDDGKTAADEQKKDDTDLETVEESGSWKDGIYYGSGTGFGGTIKVAVTVQDGKIVSIEIQSASGEGSSYLSQAKAVIDRIISQQSLNVDTVSGATYSSRGIIRAVRNALTGAADDGTLGKEEEEQEEPEELEDIKEPDAWMDGVYTGTGSGFGGDVKVEVTVQDGKIASIKVLSHKDGSSYMSKAKSVINRIISKQTTNVDTVSGATFSSQGIIKAVRNALSKASGTSNTGKMPYPEGIYYGTATGYQGDITVAVVIQDKTIKAILVTEASDDNAYLEKAKVVASNVVKKQSTSVDLVSGATYSSQGILDAIKNAIAEAKKAADAEDRGDSGGDDFGGGSGGDPGDDDTPGTIYQNGEYEGTAVCEDPHGDSFLYDLTLKITVKHDKITAITDVAGDEANSFYVNKAKKGSSKYPGVVSQILKTGVPDEVDAVSGATYSSHAILEACKNALEKARITEGGEGQ